MLAPLTSLVGDCRQIKTTKAKGTKKVPWHWGEIHQRAFDHKKATVAKDVVLAYPDYSKVFEFYTDASSKQLGAVTTQDNRPIAFFSWKLSNMQHKYSITKIELLAIVETLKEFKWMLRGQKIKEFTDHADLMRDALGLTLDRVYQWRLLLEEYGPKNIYIKGMHNTIADAVSQLEYDCENILRGYCYDGDLVFVILKGISIFKFPKRVLRSLPEISLLFFSS